LNCNLHDLTIEQILAKMQKTHFDLIDIVRNDLTRLDFPKYTRRALDDHEAAYKKHDRDAPGWFVDLEDPAWFNAAANYLAATEKVLQCKLTACSDALLDDEISTALRERAVQILLDPTDALALQHGINFIMKHHLLDQYEVQLTRVCQSPLLEKLSLNLKGAGLNGGYCVERVGTV
jgi:hypothetical protein